MKTLGIDYGTKHVGLALSDDEGLLAFPHTTLSNSKRLVKEVDFLVKEEAVERAVIGVPTLLPGQESTLAREIGRVVTALRENLSIPVETFNEAFTTKRARQKLKEAPSSDAVSEHAAAAAEILQNYLDRMNKTPHS